jgi:predicted ATPase
VKLAPSVEEVCGVGSKLDAGGSGIQPGVAIRPCRPVPGGAVGGLHPDLADALAELEGDDAFRFRHLLLRDAAYEALPKSVRVELHERFADWLEEHGGLVELDEIVGYHFEQAARYRHELGLSADDLAERAGERLAAAGRRALWREDRRTAAVLYVHLRNSRASARCSSGCTRVAN